MAQIFVVGDRVLVEPVEGEQQTESGLVLPATVTEKDQVAIGRVVKVGPGYLTANPDYSGNEPWAKPSEAVRYLPLQAEVGDFAYYLRKEGLDLNYKGTHYIVVRHSSLLALVRPDPKDVLETIQGWLGTN